MSTRKISECINIRINVGNYQHIELVKFAEEQIEFSTEAERIQKEDKLRDDLVAAMTRSMKAIPEKLGKGIDQAIEVEQSIKKAMPEWMAQGNVPNIANSAKKIELQKSADQKDAKDKAVAEASELDVKPTTSSKEDKVKGKDDDVSQEELFEDNFENGKSKDLTAERAETVQAAPEEKNGAKKDDLFDDDLFE